MPKAKKKKAATKARKAAPVVAIVKTTSAAPAKRRSSSIKRYSTTTIIAPKKKTAHKRRYSSPKTSFMGALKHEVKPAIAMAAYAWVTTGPSDTAKSLQSYLAKVPTIKALGVPLSHGLLATFIATRTKGWVHEVFDNLGAAALQRAAWNLGASNWDFGKATTLSGEDDDVALRGYIDAEEASGYEDLEGDDQD